MTLDELITKLTELRDEEGVSGEARVRMAHQPSYPHECEVIGPVTVKPNQDDIDDLENHLPDGIAQGYFEDEEDLKDGYRRLDDMRREPPVVYLLEGSYIGYGSRNLWDL